MDHDCELLNNVPVDPAILQDDELLKEKTKMISCGYCLVAQLDECRERAIKCNDTTAMKKIADQVDAIIKKISEVMRYVDRCSEEIIKRTPNHIQQMILCAKNAHKRG